MSDALKQAQQNVEMDMTPMIDCVFLLMIFFVLVIDLSQKNLEDLVLPKATYQEPDEKPPENRPILNILQNGAVVYKKTVVYNPDNGDKPDKILACLVDIRRTTKLNMKDEDIGGRKVSLVDDPILLRADKWTEWHYVGEVMKACSQPEAAFWKVELALSEEDKELKRKRN
ncbi:MAG: biopolymer transporter ExbD [Planctomycetes bacterium]|nr:biopolymer transporter ExbD [Planctomycetota bacterium]